MGEAVHAGVEPLPEVPPLKGGCAGLCVGCTPTACTGVKYEDVLDVRPFPRILRRTGVMCVRFVCVCVCV